MYLLVAVFPQGEKWFLFLILFLIIKL